MSLTIAPLTRLLPEPGQPFVVYAIWAEDHDPDDGLTVWAPPLESAVVRFSAANLPGGPLGEFAVSGSLAEPLSQVDPAELPIALSLRLDEVDGHGVWRFDFLGQSDAFADIWRIPPDVQPSGPVPLTPDQLNQGAEDMLREALGLPDGAPIPEPGGKLQGEEINGEPYRFDPTRHMDLQSAEPPPPLPEPAAPGPPPPPGSQEFFAPPIPTPQDKRHGAFGDATVPFAH